MQAQAGLLAHDGAQKGRARAVVHIGRARLVDHGGGQEVADPVHAGPGHLLHAAAHGQHVVDGQLLQILAGLGGGELGEDVDDPLVQLHQPLGVGDAHGGGGVGLGVALKAVADAGGIGGPPALGAHLAAAHDHQAVGLGVAALQFVQQAHDGAAGYAHRLGGNALKFFPEHMTALRFYKYSSGYGSILSSPRPPRF